MNGGNPDNVAVKMEQIKEELKDIKTEGHTLSLSHMRLEDGDMNLVVELAEAQGKTEIHLGKFKVTGGGTI